MHNGRDHSGCGRNRQADKVTLRTRLGLGLQIKTRQAKRSTNDKSKAGQRSKLMHVPGSTAFDALTGAETPVESQYRWSEAERDDIGQGVELETKVARGSRQTVNAAVESMENLAAYDEH